MSAQELAIFASNAHLPNGYRQPQVQQVSRSIPSGNIELTPEQQQFILDQVSKLVEKQGTVQQPQAQGFTTVSLTSRNQPRHEESKLVDVEQLEFTSPELESSSSVSTKATATDQTDSDTWMAATVKQMRNIGSSKTIQQSQIVNTTQQTQAQRRTIQAGQFGSAQVLQPHYNPSNLSTSSKSSYSAVRSTVSTAPVVQNTDFYARGPATIRCVIEAANKHSVPPHVLLGIASKERGKNGQEVKNSNATYDLGHFQLNTIHFKPGQAFGHINLDDAKWRGCYNAELAAWHLNRQLTLKSKRNEDFWTKAGGYHSWTPKYNRIYVYGTAKNKGLIQYAQEWEKWLKGNPNILTNAK